MKIIKGQDGSLTFVQHLASVHEALYRGEQYYIAACLPIAGIEEDDKLYLGHYPNCKQRKQIMGEIECFLLNDERLYVMPLAMKV